MSMSPRSRPFHSDTMKLEEQHHDCCLTSSFNFAFAFDDPSFSDWTLKLLICDDPWEKSRNRSTKGWKPSALIKSLRRRKEDIPQKMKELRVKHVNLCSAILAARSSFFRKLFTDQMKGCQLTLRIYSSEEFAIMEVLKLMYNNNLLSANSPKDWLEVLLAADKFEAPSCIKYCCQMLLSFPMTADLALLIDLPSILSINVIQPLLDAAKDFLPHIVKDISIYYEGIINLSLDGIKTILSRDDLRVDSEDEAYDLLMEWLAEHFLDPQDRRRVLKAGIFDLIRFQYVSPQKLKSILDDISDSNHLDPSVVTSMMKAIVLDGGKLSLPANGRTYNLLPVSVMTFKIPMKQSVVFLDLKIEEYKDVTYLQSQTFILAENAFFLSVERCEHEVKGYTFGFFLCGSSGEKQSLECEFAWRQKSSPREFVKLQETLAYTFDEFYRYGSYDLFDAPWDAVMAEDSQFFINGTMHLRVDITLVD